ncbi:MAG: hypothetical protein QNL33_15000 [Akkermansiaceae bacterium]
MKEPVIRTLTNTEGQEIEAELIILEGEILHAKVQGRTFQIPLKTLSEADQTFLQAWASDELQ